MNQEHKEQLDRIEQKLDLLIGEKIREAIYEPPQDWVPVEEAYEICHISKFSLRQACSTGRIMDCYKNDNGRWMISRALAVHMRDYGLPLEEKSKK